jgi:hypothetical protein
VLLIVGLPLARTSSYVTSMDEKHDPLATAHHEAGHAVASILWFHRAFKRVSVVEDDDSWGHVEQPLPGTWFRPDIEVDGRVRRRIEKEVMILWAGPLCEERLTGRFNEALADSDLRTMEHLASYVTGAAEETAAYIEWLRLRTLGEMHRPGWYFWPCVDALAEALIEQKTFGYRKARELVVGTQQRLMQEFLDQHRVVVG